MGEEFYSSIKLVTGEEIFSLVSIDENDGDPLLILQNPVIIKFIENNMGVMIKIKPWMTIPDDDFYIIRYDKVVTMTEVKDKKILFIYNRYLNEENEKDTTEESDDGKVKLSDKLGYIGSVEQARKKLETLFKDIKDS